MARPREIVEALLFLPAMALLAGAIFLAFWLVIWLGNHILFLVHDLARLSGLPMPIALTLGVFASAFGVYGLYYALFERR